MTIVRVDRRALLKLGIAGGAGLFIGCNLFKKAADKRVPGDAFELNAFVLVDATDFVTVIVPESEMGQGILTSVAMIVADELDADWSKVRAVHAPAKKKDYGWQITGNSTSIRNGFDNFRRMGAAAREMLVLAASKVWDVDPSQITTDANTVLHAPTTRRLSYGELARRASHETAPREPKLKDPKRATLVGKPLTRIDLEAKVNGSAMFGIDVQRPGMLVAQVERPPVLGGKLKGFNATKALAVPGVRHVVGIPTGVAVVADHFWAAKLGREALEVEWEKGPAASGSSATIRASLEALIEKSREIKKIGDPAAALQKAARRIDAIYEVPHLAHAAMEPMNCTAEVTKKHCEVWVGTQAVSEVMELAEQISGLDSEYIRVHTMFLGGGFGRRAKTDFVADALHTSRLVGKPVKVIWTREDDIRNGWYRPTALASLSGALDDTGTPIVWRHAIAAPTILGVKDGIDPFAIEGVTEFPYAIPNFLLSHAHPADQWVPTWFWRANGHSWNAYFIECFLDELAALAGRDPIEMRRGLLKDRPRHRRVLELAAERAGWGKPLPSGVAAGVAVHESYGSFCAQIAEVSLEPGGRVRVHRVVAAIDCGSVVNPDTIVAQVESGIAWGLSAALYGELTFKDGSTVESNFHDYRILRFPEMPQVETHIVDESMPRGGVGEVAVAPIAPAVANAIFKLTGKPIRKFPIRNVV